MISSTRQIIESTKYWLQMMMPSVSMFVFIGFALVMGSMIVLSIIPIYIENKSVGKTSYILTTVGMNNYTLYMSRSLGKRDLLRLTSSTNTTDVSTLGAALATMNASIQYGLEQQLQAGDNQDKFNIYILQMTAHTDDPSNMSVTLNFLIVYTRECASCNQRRQSIISKQLGSNNQLSTPIRFLIQYANLSYTLSGPITVYTTNIPIGNIIIITQTVSQSQFFNPINTIETNGSTQISNKFLASNYTLTVTTSKTNYFAILQETVSQNSASQNAGPVPLAGALSMYPGLMQTIERQLQYSNGSNAPNITINQIILQFWYLNSTIQVMVNFLINYSTSCNNQCTNQRSNQLINQLGNLTNTSISIQPANLSDGQVTIFENGIYVLFNYSLTSQVITNFTGTIVYATPPVLTILY